MEFDKLNVIEKVVGGAGYVTGSVAGGVVALGEYVYRRTIGHETHSEADLKASRTVSKIAELGGEVAVQAAPEVFNALVGHFMGNALAKKPNGGNTDNCKCNT